jgi:hypothetical protein
MGCRKHFFIERMLPGGKVVVIDCSDKGDSGYFEHYKQTLTRFVRMEATTIRSKGTSGIELDEGDEWTPTLAEHTILGELGIPFRSRLRGE